MFSIVYTLTFKSVYVSLMWSLLLFSYKHHVLEGLPNPQYLLIIYSHFCREIL